jgi:hypothetical protein
VLDKVLDYFELVPHGTTSVKATDIEDALLKLGNRSPERVNIWAKAQGLEVFRTASHYQLKKV